MRDPSAIRIRPPDRPGRSETLNGLFYPGPKNIGAEYVTMLQNALITVGFAYYSCGRGPRTHFTWRGSKSCLGRTRLMGHVFCSCYPLLLVPGFLATSSRTMPSRSVVAVLVCSLCVVANVKYFSFPKAPIIARKVRCLEFNNQELSPRKYEVP